MPVRGQAQPPRRVGVALLVDDDLCLPGAADVLDPVDGGGFVAVGDGYGVDLGVVLYGEGGQVAEGFLGDCVFGSIGLISCCLVGGRVGTWGRNIGGRAAGLHGQPQCRRKTTIVGLSGSFSFSCVGADSPTLGMGAVCFAGGDLKDWNSFANISVRVGGAMVSVCRACQGIMV